MINDSNGSESVAPQSTAIQFQFPRSLNRSFDRLSTSLSLSTQDDAEPERRLQL